MKSESNEASIVALLDTRLPVMLRTSRSLLAAALLAIAAGACGSEEPTAPPAPGSIRTTTLTTGGDPDIDGYDLLLGTTVRQPLPPNGTTVTQVESGTHTVALARVDENCTVSGAYPRTVAVPPGAQVYVNIEVACVATGIEVITRTAGAEHAPPHHVSLNGAWAGSLGANASVVISRLRPGTYKVGLGLYGSHCRISGSNPLTIEVTSRAVTPVSFEAVCVAPTTRPEKIAYTDGGIVATVNSDGSGATDLVAGHSPAWSPDGSKLVFSNTNCDYYSDACTGGIAVLDLETKTVTPLESGEHGSTPAWAPTGDVIAFRALNGRLAIASLGQSAAIWADTPGVTYSWSPSWSPDGQRVVFGCYSGGASLCVVNRDGTNFQRLTPGWNPAWGPHGRIAFERGGGPQPDRIVIPEIVILDSDGRTTTVAVGHSPAWSRDGSKLVFLGTGGLFVINADGTNLRRLTTGAHHRPAWRP